MTDMTDGTAATSMVAPELAAQIRDAPGHGILPGISPHLAGEAQLFHLDAQPVERINDLLFRQYLYGTNCTFVKWTAKKGSVIPLTHHVNEQITWITAGLAEVYSQGRRYLMKAGDVMIIPPNVPHEFRYLEDTIDIDIFAPGRQDWIDGTATYLRQK
jgi:quercetin dioxygenase-like cupin family protein